MAAEEKVGFPIGFQAKSGNFLSVEEAATERKAIVLAYSSLMLNFFIKLAY